jgi:HSP20 family molecular chaperone IbpA
METIFLKTKESFKLKEGLSSPAQYISAPVTWETLQEKSGRKWNQMKSPFQTSEHDHHFKLELSIPSCHRDDFTILIKGRLLLINVKNVSFTTEHTKSLKAILDRKIILPKNLDPDFMSAEYQNGILSIFFSKTNRSYQNKVEQIFVY